MWLIASLVVMGISLARWQSWQRGYVVSESQRRGGVAVIVLASAVAYAVGAGMGL